MQKVYKNVFKKYNCEKSKGNNFKEKYLGIRIHNMAVVLN